MRRLIVRWSTWVAGLLAASIPVVDQLDVYVNTWWADALDGIWTIVACIVLVWLVDVVRRATK